MKINDINNLFVGYDEEDDFRVLICASDEKEAEEIAKSYKEGGNLSGEFTISELEGNERFDCDYVLTYDNIHSTQGRVVHVSAYPYTTQHGTLFVPDDVEDEDDYIRNNIDKINYDETHFSYLGTDFEYYYD